MKGVTVLLALLLCGQAAGRDFSRGCGRRQLCAPAKSCNCFRVVWGIAREKCRLGCCYGKIASASSKALPFQVAHPELGVSLSSEIIARDDSVEAPPPLVCDTELLTIVSHDHEQLNHVFDVLDDAGVEYMVLRLGIGRTIIVPKSKHQEALAILRKERP